jgi:hypothetical protein
MAAKQFFRPFKKAFKILAYFIGIVLLLLIVLLVTAKLAEDTITDLAMKKVSQTIKAPVAIDKVSFNLLRRFPLATIELQGICLGAPDSLLTCDSTVLVRDTLMNIGRVYVSVKSKPLMDGVIDIVKIELEQVQLSYLVAADSSTNFDFLMDTTATDTVPEPQVAEDTTSVPLNLSLEEFLLTDIRCFYSDSTLKAQAQVNIPEMKISARAQGDMYAARIKGNIKLTNCAFEGTNLNLMKETEARFDVDYDADKATIHNLALLTDGAELYASGTAIVKDTITTDLVIEGKKINLKELMKYALADILKEYGVRNAEGILSFKATVKGDYSDSLMPRVDASIEFENGLMDTKDYPLIRNMELKGFVTNGEKCTNQTTLAKFETVHAKIGNSRFDAAFEVSDLDHINYVFETHSTIDVTDFASFIPDSLLESITGVVKIDFKTKGVLPDSIGDDFTDYAMARTTAKMELQNFNITMDSALSVKKMGGTFIYEPNRFTVKNFTVSVPDYKVKLKNTGFDTRFTGSINHMDKMTVDVKNFRLETDSSQITASVFLKNLEQPEYRFNGQVNLNLAEIKNMVPDTLVTVLDGIFNLQMQSSGKINLDSIADQSTDLAFKNSTFKMAVSNMNVVLPDSSLVLHNFSGKVFMKDDSIAIEKVHGNYSGIDFKIDNTQIWNVYKAFMKNLPQYDLIVHTDVELGTIENEFIQAMMATDTTAVDSSATTNEKVMNETVAENTQSTPVTDSTSVDTLGAGAFLPNYKELGMPHFVVYGKMGVKKITYEKNVIDDISMLFRFSDSLYVIDQFKLKTCGGEVNTSLKFDARKWEQPVVDIKNAVEHLDVKQLLMVNDNFGDTALTYDKVSGILTSDFNVRAFYVKGDWPTEKIRAKGTLKLTDGKIYNYPPLVDLSMSIGGLKELDKLDFNTLTTSIFVFKDKIYIPKTDIVSSALDISAAAMQSFKEDFEYHLVLHLNDVLIGKSEKLLRQQAEQSKKEGETEERDGLKLVAMEIAPDKKYGFDNVKLYKKFLNEINKQEGFLNLLFNPLLVNFSTDFDRTIRNKELLEKLNNPGSGTKE